MNRVVQYSLLAPAIVLLGVLAPGEGLWAASPTYTPTLTVTPTVSQTSTSTRTPTSTNTPTYEFWRDDFTAGPPGAQPAGWQDESDDSLFNAHISYSYLASLAAVTRTADSTWGKVLSPLQSPNTSIFSYVEICVTTLSPSMTWKVGIQEINGAWQYRDLTPSMSVTGTFILNYASVMGWAGLGRSFRIQLTAEGGPGTYFVVDYVTVRMPPPTPTPTVTPTFSATATFTSTATLTGTETVTSTPSLTASSTSTTTHTATPSLTYTRTPMNTATSTWTDSPTISPTATITSSATLTPTRLNTLTPSPTPTTTPTLTLTPVPLVGAQGVRVYPNPARGSVTIAYAVSGQVQVFLDIYNMNAERVAHSVEQQDGGAGQVLRTVWNASDCAPGVYLARVQIKDARGGEILSEVKKVALLK